MTYCGAEAEGERVASAPTSCLHTSQSRKTKMAPGGASEASPLLGAQPEARPA